MLKSEIKVGGHYIAKVGVNVTTVRVDRIEEVEGRPTGNIWGDKRRDTTRYHVTNLTTGRTTTFRSAAKFRRVAQASPVPAPSYEQKTIAVVEPVEVLEDTVCECTYPEEAPGEQCEVCGGTVPGAKKVAAPTPVAVEAPKPVSALAASIASVPAAPARKHPLTEEQETIIRAALVEPILVIEAGAGCGKTSTLVELAKAMPGRGQYTAFNASLVAESSAKFPSSCPCNTIHSLAFRQEGIKYKHRLNKGRVRTSEVAAMLSVAPLTVKGADGKDKVLDGGMLVALLLKAIKRFCHSADKQVSGRLLGRVVVSGVRDEDQELVREYLTPYLSKIWDDIKNPKGTLPFTHDHYVKLWQLNSPIISASYILLDEAQDTSPVMLDVLAQQVARGTKVILVGDSGQQIYSWRGAVNALAAFPEARRLTLSQSFRFGPVVAEVANAVLEHLAEKTPLVLKGFGKVVSRLTRLAINPPAGTQIAEPDAIICRTNAGAVQSLFDAIANGKRPHLVGGGDDVLKFVRAALDLQQGRRTDHPELCVFESWNEVKLFSKTDEGEDLKLMVRLIESFTAQRIADALKHMPAERDADLVICTAHKSKGREWRRVRLASDFVPLSKMCDEELRLLYVAATRAQNLLDLETCPPFLSEGKDGEREERRINLATARRLSEEIAAAAPSFASAASEEVKAAPQAAAAQDGGKAVPAPKNNWTKHSDGRWLIRGVPGQAGRVTVYRRDGSKSEEQLGAVVWQDAANALYEVVKKR